MKSNSHTHSNADRNQATATLDPDGSSEMTSPLAVLMAVYGQDSAPLFERALLSVLDQDWKHTPIRIYLCVDGNIDPTVECILEKHQHRVYKILRNQARQGLARSLNLLLGELEDEEFVFRMDSDDYSHPNRFSIQIAAALENPDIDILGCAIHEVDSRGRTLRTVTYPQTAKAIYNAIPRRSPLAHPTVCFRRRAIRQFGRYPETKVGQDLALWYKCLESGLCLSNVDIPLYDLTVSDAFYRRRGDTSRAFEELSIAVNGIWRTHGLTWRLIFPFLKAAFRLAPKQIIVLAYRSRLR